MRLEIIEREETVPSRERGAGDVTLVGPLPPRALLFALCGTRYSLPPTSNSSVIRVRLGAKQLNRNETLMKQLDRVIRRLFTFW